MLLNHKSFKKLFLPVFILMIMIAASFAVYYCNYQNIKQNGIALIPSKNYEIINVPYYLQSDERWSKDKIGLTQSTIASTGCLISCISSSISSLGTEVTPKQLNKEMTKISGFQDDNLIWNKINKAFPEFEYDYKSVFDSQTIENDLKKGLTPIVNVKYNKTGITHWVLIIGAQDGEFIIYDPANKDKTYIPLSKHGYVYTYRVVARKSIFKTQKD